VTSLNARAFYGFLGLLVAMGAALFLSAWTIHYWQAWIFLAVFGGSALAITMYLMKNDPKLLERRVYAGPTAEKETSQKLIQFLASLAFIAMLAVSSLDHRFSLSTVPFSVTVLGDVLVALGFVIIFFVYKENSFASATIEVYAEQTVISGGPYTLVRHPMYAGAFVLLLGMAPALGSWWGLLILPFMMPVLIWRLLDEETLLTRTLPGYVDYKRKVTYRLMPFVW
jgi:protein-S-isoprenylcysteine O-methyltransferase Ste14